MAPHRARPDPAMQEAALQAHAALVAALRARLAVDGDVVTTIETHISSVLLAGDLAYKLKKPVDLGFLDFTTLEARRRTCELELALNRRTAPQLYLAVVPVTGTPQAPALDGAGPAIDYAVKMRRFETADSLDALLERGALEPALVDALAARVAAFHAAIETAPPDGEYGSAERILSDALDNFTHIARLAAPPETLDRLDALRRWTEAEGAQLRDTFAARKAQGFVRECHGDLHLGNVARVDGAPVPFDCIEFNPAFRWIDVMSELAFTLMDFIDRGAAALGWRFLNRVLEASGDYAGVALLRFYLVYRAMVRAKVALIRARQLDADGAPAAQAAMRDFLRHVADASGFAARPRPALVVAGGLSGSGKTTLAHRLLEAIGALHLRSDVERKRLHGLAAAARSGSAPGAGLYTARASEATYTRLAVLARALLPTGFPVIVDATFLHEAERTAFRALAGEIGARFILLWCDAPLDVLRERVAARAADGRDASEATLEVLTRQLEALEPPAAGAEYIACDTSEPANLQAALREAARRCGADTTG